MKFSDPGLLGIRIFWPRIGKDVITGVFLVVNFLGDLVVVALSLLVVLLALTVVVVVVVTGGAVVAVEVGRGGATVGN